MDLIYFVLVIYLIPIIVGTPKNNKDYSPQENFTLQIHYDCFDSIHRIFDVPLPPLRKYKKEYFQFAILYLRSATNEESDAYNQILTREGHPISRFLLYHGKDGTFYNEEFAHAYYLYLSTRFEVLGDKFLPYVFCQQYTVEEKTCKDTLEKFGFVRENMAEIIRFAYLKIVNEDIESHYYNRGPIFPFDPDMTQPKSTPIVERYAMDYLLLLYANANLKQGNISWPEVYAVLLIMRRVHHDCFDSIQRMFEVHIPTREYKKEYFHYGILYLRFATIKETIAYNRKLAAKKQSFNLFSNNKKLAPGEHPYFQYLLYNGKYNQVYNEEFAYKYFVYLSTIFELLSDDLLPYAFCHNYPVDEVSCRYTLEKFGFVKKNMKEVIYFAFSNIAFHDIEHHKFIPEPNRPELEPYYAMTYLMVFYGNTNIHSGGNIYWPEVYCIRFYKEERHDIDIIYD